MTGAKPDPNVRFNPRHRWGCKFIRQMIPLRLSPMWVEWRRVGIYHWDIQWIGDPPYNGMVGVCQQCMPLMLMQQLKYRGIHDKRKKKHRYPDLMPSD